MSKKWSELTDTQRRMVVVGGVVQVGLQAAALRDLHRRSPSQVNGRRGWWVAASFVNLLGPIAYVFFGRRRGSS